MSTPAAAASAFDLKSTTWTLTALRLHTASTADVDAALARKFGATPGLFDGDALVFDLALLRDEAVVPDFAALIALVERHRLRPLAVQGGNETQMQAARAAGLAEALDAAPEPVRAQAPRVGVVLPVVDQAIELGDPVPVALPPDAEPDPPARAPTPPAPEPSSAGVPTLVVDKPLRSGQRVYARGADLVVLAGVNFGAEVIADGHVHVYGPLRGRAIAGARGDTTARIFSTALEPQLIAIAGIYRALESPLGEQVWGRPAQVRLVGEKLLVDPIDIS